MLHSSATANVEVNDCKAPQQIWIEFDSAHTLIEIKIAKPKAVTSAATTTTTTRPKARGINLLLMKNARKSEAQLQAELIEEERIARQKEEEANIALLESWDNTQAMMEADFELA
ncbi:hypothetical protein Tco_0604237 [Tanacetum coccineum]